jgi:single-stranded DNA-binding protein
MAKIRLIGIVATDVVAGTVGQNINFVKYLVKVVSTSTQNNNPRMAQNNDAKNSFFAVTAFGKNAELAIQKGITVEIDGNLEIAEFQMSNQTAAKKAAIVNPKHITILQGNVQHYAKAYNVLGNLTKAEAEIYQPQTGKNTVYTQTLAVNRKVGDNEYTSFFDIKFFGERGDKLYSKQLLNKSKVKSLLIDGSISATYTKKEDASAPGGSKEYFNCSINADDFQIAAFSSNQQNQNYGTNGYQQNNNAYNQASQNAGQPEIVYETPEIPEIDIDDEIPF